MPLQTESPAVQSMRKEQAAQRDRAGQEGNLDQGLEDTFPASDPVSATHTSTNAGSSAKNAEEAAPLVDDALAATGERATAFGRRDHTDARALRTEAERRAAEAADLVSGAAQMTEVHGQSLLSDIEDRVRRRPLTAVALVGIIAFFVGVTR